MGSTFVATHAGATHPFALSSSFIYMCSASYPSSHLCTKHLRMDDAAPLKSNRSYHHRSESSIQLSESDKFFCKLLEKESDECISPTRDSSFRVYYGVSKSSIPFLWETAPGTPKHDLTLNKDGVANIVVPPLTPPPRNIKYVSGNSSVERRPRKVLKGFRLRIRSNKRGMYHFNYLFKSQWTNALGRKALLPLRSWRSVVRFWSRSGKGREGIHSKATSLGGCFSSGAKMQNELP